MSENTPIQRLLGSIKVNEETACWEWQKHLVKGYGRTCNAAAARRYKRSKDGAE